MVLGYGVGADALVPGLDDVSRAAILDDCIEIHLEHVQRARQAALRARLAGMTL
jgi:hypothetical protein